ncbi:MAG: Holliday junction branch migration protein RuvA [Pseudomonadales bacterium]|nr:Holliday junction branch migration protein RuvA [Pseudomonadales bacterium]
MIGRLQGKLLDISGNDILIDVNGIGYEVEVAASVIELGPTTGQSLTVHTHFVVREDAQLLFGFATQAERDLFRGFIKINGVGPKMGLALISSLDAQALAIAVRNEDVSMLTRVPGVGKKTAERLMVELKNRIDELTAAAGVSLQVVDVSPNFDGATREAEDALIALGYRPTDASRTIAGVLARSEGDLTVEEIVRQALRSIAGQKGSNAGSPS